MLTDTILTKANWQEAVCAAVAEPNPEKLAEFNVGNAALTRRVKALAKAAGVEVTPVTEFNGYGNVRVGYRVERSILEEARRQLQAEQSSKVAKIDVLAALFTLNRRAKRCRDLAQGYYLSKQHGLAGKMRSEKEEVYDLKGQALHHLLAEGRLKVVGLHRFEGGNHAEVLEGDGFRFHRPCPDPTPAPGSESAAALLDSIEAKPKGAKEPTLAAALAVVRGYLEGRPRVTVYEWPTKRRAGREFRPRSSSNFRSDDFDDDFEDEY